MSDTAKIYNHQKLATQLPTQQNTTIGTSAVALSTS